MDMNQIVDDLTSLTLSQLRSYCDLARSTADGQQLSYANSELDRRLMNMSMDFLAAQQTLIQTQSQVNSMSASLASTTRTLASMQKGKTNSTLKFQPPSKFSGDVTTLRTWLFSVRQYFTACGLTDQAKMQQFAATLLEKNALIWWESMCTSNPNAPLTWTFEQDFVPALQLAFRDLGHEQRVLAAFEQWNSVKGETMEQYIARFRQLCTDLSQVNHLPDQATLIHKFTLRLAPDARFWFGVSKPPTIDDSYQLAQDWDAANQLRIGKTPAQAPAQQQVQSHVPMDVDAIRQQIASLQLQLDAVTGQSANVASSSSTPPRMNIVPRSTSTNVCFRCGRGNHMVKQCRARYHINGTLLPGAQQSAPTRGRTQALRWVQVPVDQPDEKFPPAPSHGNLN